MIWVTIRAAISFVSILRKRYPTCQAHRPAAKKFFNDKAKVVKYYDARRDAGVTTGNKQGIGLSRRLIRSGVQVGDERATDDVLCTERFIRCRGIAVREEKMAGFLELGRR